MGLETLIFTDGPETESLVMGTIVFLGLVLAMRKSSRMFSLDSGFLEVTFAAEMGVSDLGVIFLDVDTLEDVTALGESVSFLVKRASLVAVILGSEMLRLGMLFVVDLFLDIFLFLGLVMDKQSTNYTAIIILKIGVRVFINLYFF